MIETDTIREAANELRAYHGGEPTAAAWAALLDTIADGGSHGVGDVWSAALSVAESILTDEDPPHTDAARAGTR